jgi:uncharacterized membrane protein
MSKSAYLAADERVGMRQGLVAVAISGDRIIVDVVDWSLLVGLEEYRTREDVRKGPPDVGRFSNWTVKLTP